MIYLFWIVSGLLAIPAIVGCLLGFLVIVAGVTLGVLLGAVLSVPLGIWFVLADAKFWKSLTHGKLTDN